MGSDLEEFEKCEYHQTHSIKEKIFKELRNRKK